MTAADGGLTILTNLLLSAVVVVRISEILA
jgi:hypothetical protein